MIISKIWSAIKTAALYLWKVRDLALAVVVFILVFLLNAQRRNNGTDEKYTNALELLKKEKAANGQLYATISQALVSEDEAKKRADSLAVLLKIKPKTIKGATVFTTIIDTVFNDKTVVVVDTLSETPTYITEHHDPWVDITTRVNADEGEIRFQIRDTVSVVFTEKNPLIGRKKLTANVYSTNPYIQHNSGYSFTTKPKEVILAIGPTINYNPFTNKVDFGIGATVPLIKIRK